MITCRCNMCGAKNAGKAGAKSFGQAVCPRDEFGNSFEFGRDRRSERRLRRTREARAWQAEVSDILADESDNLAELFDFLEEFNLL